MTIDSDLDSLEVNVEHGQLLAAARIGEATVAIAQPIDAGVPESELRYIARESIQLARARSVLEDDEDSSEPTGELPGETGGAASTPGYGAANGGVSSGD